MPEGPGLYIMVNGGVLVLILGQLLRLERRFGCGDAILGRIKNHCPLFNGRGSEHGKEKKESKMGEDRGSQVS